MQAQPTVITQPAGQTTVVVASNQAVPAPIPGPKSFRDTPLRCTCPNCGNVILSTLQYEIGVYTVVLSIIMCVFGLVLGCCVIPFFMNGCKDVVHICPTCQHRLGKYVKM